MISYITDIYENNSTLTQYELQFLRIDTKGINKKEIISQIIYKTASNNFQESKCAYSIQKVVQASFSQGHPKFGSTRGIQCTCISLFSICFSIFKTVSRWNRHDIEYVIEKGDALYKMQNTNQLLSYTQLPRVVQVEHLLVPVNFLEDCYGIWNDSQQQNIINVTRQILNSYNCTGLLFLTEGVCVSVIPSKCGYFVVDSHSRNSSGKADLRGSAILLRFQSVVDLSKYIIDTYDRSGKSVQYEIQEILVDSSGIPQKEKQRVVSSHKSEYQHAVILDKQNKKRKREYKKIVRECLQEK